MSAVSSFAIPCVILIIIVAALLKNVPVYDTFLEGAKTGLKTSVNIVAPLVGLLCAISMFRASGALELMSYGLSHAVSFLGFPKEVLPLALLRPISGSASLAVTRNILQTYGADSFAGRVASVISGSTETTLYAISVYFGAVGIKKSRYTLKSALMADFTGFIVAAFAVRFFLG